jgi:urease accessory protein
MVSSLIHILRLASPALPVGAYSYSQGFESAVETGRVWDFSSARAWIADALVFSVARAEAPAVAALFGSWRAGDTEAAETLNGLILASRETAEARAETAQMGHSLTRLLANLGLPAATHLVRWDEVAYPTAFSAAAAHWSLDEKDAVTAYLWAWLENQVMAAVKLVPLGQTAGQKILLEISESIPALADEASVAAEPAHWRNFTPGLALCSSLHETQYSRLFRS